MSHLQMSRDNGIFFSPLEDHVIVIRNYRSKKMFQFISDSSERAKRAQLMRMNVFDEDHMQNGREDT